MHNKKTTVLFLAVVMLLGAFSANAWAYIDPGSGSLILQMVLSVAAGVFLVLSKFSKKIKTTAGRVWKAFRREREQR